MHLTVVFISNVGDMRKDEVLLSQGFVEEVLDGSVYVASEVWPYDFLGKLSKQRGWDAVKRQIHEEIVFCS